MSLAAPCVKQAAAFAALMVFLICVFAGDCKPSVFGQLFNACRIHAAQIVGSPTFNGYGYARRAVAHRYSGAVGRSDAQSVKRNIRINAVFNKDFCVDKLIVYALYCYWCAFQNGQQAIIFVIAVISVRSGSSAYKKYATYIFFSFSSVCADGQGSACYHCRNSKGASCEQCRNLGFSTMLLFHFVTPPLFFLFCRSFSAEFIY